MAKQNTDYLTEGLTAQHTIYERLEEKYSKLPRYIIEESPEGSLKDLVDKSDISILDKLNPTVPAKAYDVKSSQYPDKITYTHVNSQGRKSKIYSGDFSIDLIFTFETYNKGYFVKAEDFYKLLEDKIKNGQEHPGKTKPKSKYVWFSKDELIAIAYDVI